jgi:tetratricopeptide (TPR) repeat protein
VGDRYVERSAQQGELLSMAYGNEPIPEVRAALEGTFQGDVSLVNRGFALGLGGELDAFLGDVNEGLARVVEARRIALALGLEMIWAALAQAYAEVAELADMNEEARDVLTEACATLEAAGEVAWLSTCAAQLAYIFCRLEDYVAAESWAQKSRESSATTDLVSQALWRSAMSRILVARGELAEGLALSNEAVAFLEDTDLLLHRATVYIHRAEMLIAAGHHEDAVQSLAKATEIFEAKGAVQGVEWARSIEGSISRGST